MNLRNNEGFTGVDISIAIIIILIFIPTIFGSVYSIQKNSNSVKRESRAVKVASNILEIAKSVGYEDLKFSEGSNYTQALNENYEQYRSSADDNANCLFKGTDGEYYKIDIKISNYYPEGIEEEDKEDFVKKVNVVVTYTVANKQKKVEISTVLSKT